MVQTRKRRKQRVSDGTPGPDVCGVMTLAGVILLMVSFGSGWLVEVAALIFLVFGAVLLAACLASENSADASGATANRDRS